MINTETRQTEMVQAQQDQTIYLENENQMAKDMVKSKSHFAPQQTPSLQAHLKQLEKKADSRNFQSQTGTVKGDSVTPTQLNLDLEPDIMVIGNQEKQGSSKHKRNQTLMHVIGKMTEQGKMQSDVLTLSRHSVKNSTKNAPLIQIEDDKGFQKLDTRSKSVITSTQKSSQSEHWTEKLAKKHKLAPYQTNKDKMILNRIKKTHDNDIIGKLQARKLEKNAESDGFLPTTQDSTKVNH